MYNCGQVCCASKRFLVHNRVRDEFVRKASQRMKEIKVGTPDNEQTQIACLVTESAAQRVEEQVNKTVEQGGKIVLGGKRNGAFYEPTILNDIPKSADVAKDMEIFGPVVSVIGFDTIEEAIEIANASKYGLAGCIFSSNMKTAMKVATSLECGSVVINGASFYRSFEMPFGGYKYSGLGTEGVLSTYAEVTRTKTVVLKDILA
jgi:succinate-semialdehyde dehydrogenase/glutarate-semialdehyde dehydrogenase